MQSPALLPDESLSKKLITKGFWTYFFTLIIAPSGYLLRMWFSDAVSVAEVGIFYSVLGLVVMLSSYNDLGLTEAMMYFIPKFWINQEPAKARRVLLASFLMQMFTGVLIFILIYRGADRLAVHHFHQPASAGTIKILAAYFLGMNLLTLCITLFSSFQDTFSQGLTFAMQQLITLVFTLIFRSTASLSLLTYSWIRLWGLITAIVTGVSILAYKYKKVLLPPKDQPFLPPSTIKKQVLKEHMHYAIRVFLVANVSNLLASVDQQIIINVLGPQAAGLFSNFQALLMVFLSIVTPMFGLLFPITTELATKQEEKKFWLLQHLMYSYFGVVALVIATFFIVFGQEIAVFLFGEEFRFSGYMLQRAAPALLFSCRSSISLGMLAGLGKIKQRLWVVALALAVNLLLNRIFLIRAGKGLVYSAMILSVSWVVMAGGGMRVIYKAHPFTLDRKLLGKNLFLLILLALLMQRTKTAGLGGIFSISGLNLSRRELFFFLAARFAIYAGLVLLFNGGKIKRLLQEIKQLKANR